MGKSLKSRRYVQSVFFSSVLSFASLSPVDNFQLLARIASSNPMQCTANILSPFLSTAPLQHVPKIQFTPATIDCHTTDKTKNALHKETVILNYIGGEPISHGLSNEPFVKVLCTKWAIKICRVVKRWDFYSSDLMYYVFEIRTPESCFLNI